MAASNGPCVQLGRMGRRNRRRRRLRRCRRSSRRGRSCAWSRGRRTRGRARAGRRWRTARPPSRARRRRDGRRSAIGVALVEPGRSATTVVSVCSPSIVWPSRCGGRAPESRRRRCRRDLAGWRRCGGRDASSPGLPGRRSGNRRPGAAVRRTRAGPSKASGASVVVSGAGRGAEREGGDGEGEQERQRRPPGTGAR